MHLRVDPGGRVTCVYGEAIDLAALGPVAIRRASHVEPDDQGRWWADLAPVTGPAASPLRFPPGAPRGGGRLAGRPPPPPAAPPLSACPSPADRAAGAPTVSAALPHFPFTNPRCL